jgi:hypothetical protein
MLIPLPPLRRGCNPEMSLDPASAHAQHIDILIIYPVAGREARRLIQTSL